MVPVGQRLTLTFRVWRGSAVNVIWVSVAVARDDDRQGRRGAASVRQFVAGQAVHRDNREEHCKESLQRMEIKPPRVLPTQDHAIGL